MIITVLKIIGIILLVILGLIIFIIGMVLLLPIRYRFDTIYEKQLDGEVVVKWAPVLFKAMVTFVDGKPSYIVKLFGGIIATNTGKKISWLGRKLFAEEEETSDKTSAAVNKEEYKTSVGNNPKPTSYEIVPQDDIKFEKPEESVKKKKKVSVINKIKQKLASLQKKWKNFVTKLKDINQKREDLLRVYHSKRFEVAKKDVILYLKKLFYIIKPDKLEGRVKFGFDDPATTGQVLGKLAMMLPLYDNFLIVQPDFTEKCLEGDLKGKGKIFLGSLLVLIIKVKFNNNLIKVIKKVQTIIEA